MMSKIVKHEKGSLKKEFLKNFNQSLLLAYLFKRLNLN